LADKRLQDKVSAERFANGVMMSVCAPQLGLRSKPAEDACFISQALFGDLVRVFQVADGWAWGQMEKDDYVGYMPVSGLSEENHHATHRVHVPATYIYPKADLKSQPAIRIFMNSMLAVETKENGWAGLATGGFVYLKHIRPKDQFYDDPVSVAEEFLHAPYLWGGSSVDGLDCSALVQQAYHACGKSCPRDTDMIEAEIGETGSNSLKRGDLVFWDGHIGMMVDEKKLIHANGFHMAVIVEEFSQAEQRISREYGSTPRIKRP
jgi:cell wall-associated NlpC family hydrolase